MEIRKCQKIISYQTSEVANLNPDDFRNLSIPFEGETDQEFLSYLNDNSYELYETIYEEIDNDVLIELSKFLETEWTEYHNSTWDAEDSWLESGEVGSYDVITSNQ